ncbi:MAG TPA: hypothetical protein VFM46_17705 [Pseudomonadales bacterium]|nr:hypothetical protein [Pseudomonadales bacterium]
MGDTDLFLFSGLPVAAGRPENAHRLEHILTDQTRQRAIIYMGSLALISVILFALAALSVLRPTEKLNFGLFKFASVYMLLAMALMVI